MKKSIAFLVIFIMALIEAAVINNFRIFGVAPELLLVFIIVLSFVFELRTLLILAVFAGLLKDVLSAQYFGLHIVLFSIWALVCTKLSKNFSLGHWLMLPAIVFIVVLINNIATQLILTYLNQNFLLLCFLKNTFLGSIYTASVSLIIFSVMRDLGYLTKL